MKSILILACIVGGLFSLTSPVSAYDCASSTCYTMYVRHTFDPPAWTAVCGGECINCGDDECKQRTLGRYAFCACNSNGDGNNAPCIPAILNTPTSTSGVCLPSGCTGQCIASTIEMPPGSNNYNTYCTCVGG